MTKQEYIVNLVKETTVDSDVWIAWNKETKTFSSNGACNGIAIWEEEIEGIVAGILKEMEGQDYVYMYRGKDDGIVCFEDLKGENHNELLEAYEECEVKGLFIGWD